MIRRFTRGLALGVAAALVSACAPEDRAADAQAAAPVQCDEAALRRDLARLERETGGILALAAEDVATGARLSVRGDVPVFMSSVVKLPLAIAVLRRVEANQLELDQRIVIPPTQFAPGHSPLIEGAGDESVQVTVAELIQSAVSRSDNTASDRLMALAGGPAAVTAELRSLGIDGIRVDRTYRELTAAGRGVTGLPEEWTLDVLAERTARVPAAERQAAVRRFVADESNRATPEALVRLLAALERGELLSAAGTRELLGVMTQTENPATRIVAGLPAGFTVAHKTGTWGGNEGSVAVNDVGLVRAPNREGPLALAVMVRESTVPDSTVESAMARATRRVVDAWISGETRCTPAMEQSKLDGN